jgi:hypothetical protein
MKKLLYVNGCSHSCGAEISYVGSCRVPEDLTNSWAGQLASRFNLEHVNSAISGQDNLAILSSSIHSILNLLDRCPAEDILVIIGWSGLERDHFIYDDVLYRFVPGCETLPYFKAWPNIVQTAFYNYILGTDLDSSNYNKFSLIYYAMTNFLKLHNIDYYYFNALHAVNYPNKNLLHEVDNQLPTVKIFENIQNDTNYLEPMNWEMTYYNYMRIRHDGHIDGRNHHFLADAQSEWADILAAKMQPKFALTPK